MDNSPQTPELSRAASLPAVADAAGFERFRPYLMLLARSRVDPRLRDPVDVSGIIQQTFLEAHQKLDQFRGTGDRQLAGWLRQILAHNLSDALRGFGAAKRRADRQRSLEHDLEKSSARMRAFLAADQSSPSQHLQDEERAVRLANALADLPEAQREALVLQHWQGMSLSDIAAHTGRSPAAVAGLLKRGLKE